MNRCAIPRCLLLYIKLSEEKYTPLIMTCPELRQSSSPVYLEQLVPLLELNNLNKKQESINTVL